MPKKDVLDRKDIEDIVARFYQKVLADPIIGFIFTDVAKIKLESHLPIIVDFWQDALFGSQRYSSNTLQKHLDIHRKMPLKPGHFTRWLYLFEEAVCLRHAGPNCEQMLSRADRVAKSIAAAIGQRKRQGLNLSLSDYDVKSSD